MNRQQIYNAHGTINGWFDQDTARPIFMQTSTFRCTGLELFQTADGHFVGRQGSAQGQGAAAFHELNRNEIERLAQERILCLTHSIEKWQTQLRLATEQWENIQTAPAIDGNGD
jgi:hypothetical protein